MSLQQTIKEQLKDAMGAKDEVRLNVIRNIMTAMTNEAVAIGKTPQSELTDDEVLAVLKRYAKQRKDAIDQFEKGGRADLAESEKAELAIVEAYLPAQMSEDKIREIAIAKKAEMNATDKTKAGILVGAVMKECKGQADGALVKKVVDELFA